MVQFAIRSIVVTAVLVVGGCSAGERPTEASAIAAPVSQIDALKRQYARPSMIPYPETNPYSDAKRALGHALFFDPRLSKSGTMSCASCHNPALGWEDGLARGLGSKASKLPRHTPTILNVAWAPALFWDGRADSLEKQALGPLLSDTEMGMSEGVVVGEIKNTPGYKPMFDAAFPNGGINLTTIAAALATYERTVVSSEAPFDRWVEGDERAISESAKRGFVVFNTKANCSACHSTWRFTGDGFQDIGLASKDLGRGALVKNVVELQHAFKAPTLRNVAVRAPYMHDGSLRTLEEVIRHYESGFIRRDSLSPDMPTYRLSDEERKDLIAFLETLTSDDGPVAVPVLPR